MTTKGSASPFLRPASGLVRAVGLWGAILFGVHCISLSSSGLIPFSWVASSWPGASIAWVLTIAAGLSLLHGYTFAAMGSAMPRAGADYVLGSRVIGPVPAFLASWTLVVFSGVVAGGLIAWIPKSAVPALLQPMAIIFNDTRYSDWAVYAQSSKGSLIIGSSFVALTLATMLLSTRRILLMMSAGLALGLVAWGIIYYSLLSAHSHETFVSAWNTFMGPTGAYGNFDSRIALATKAGMRINESGISMTLAGLIMGFWIYYGYYIPTFFAGEVREARSTRVLLYASWASVIVAWLIFLFAERLLSRLVSPEWIAAEGYLSNNPDAVTAAAGTKVLALPWITFYAAILKPSAWLIGIVAFAWIYTLVNLAQTYFFYTSRIVFAWSFDRIVPRSLAYVHPGTGSPVFAVIATAILAEIGVYDAAQGGPLNTQLTFAFFAVVTQVVSVTSVILFPYRMPDQFRLCPSFVRKTVLGVPVLSILAGITLLYLFWMIAASFLFPAVGVSSPLKTITLLGAIVAIGGIVYYSALRYHQRRGFDIASIYRLVPPE